MLDSNKREHQFEGWASVNNLLCDDGVIIQSGAFSIKDGEEVPLVWNHQHDDVGNVLGHAVLMNRPEGIYSYLYFNDTPNGLHAKQIAENGDIKSLSICATDVQTNGNVVTHGVIREISLVLAGANPGAKIVSTLQHGIPFDESDDEAIIYTGRGVTQRIEEYGNLQQSAIDSAKKETIADVVKTYDDEQRWAASVLIGEALLSKEASEDDEADVLEQSVLIHSAKEENTVKERVKKAVDSMNEKQKTALSVLVAEALEVDISEEDEDSDDVLEQSAKGTSWTKENHEEIVDSGKNKKEKEGKKTMLHNAFESGAYKGASVITPEMKDTIMQRAQALNSFKRAMEEATTEGGVLFQAATPTDGMETPTGTATYGINDMAMLLPDGYHPLTERPIAIDRDTGWVGKWWGKVYKTPFKRIKSWFVDITADEARARGYVKGNLKLEEVIELLKRTTDPQTIYKKQKLDRDDIVDLDFDIVPWLKGEMEVKLMEEEARATLIGDGRSSTSPDKIRESNVRPVIKDVALFNVVIKVTVPADADENEIADAIIESIILNRTEYKGTGTPTFWTTQKQMSRMLLLKDKIGRRLYDSSTALATTLMVDEIVPVDPMEGVTIEVDKKDYPLIGTIVNPVDYAVGGSTQREKLITEGFDIDYNQEKYLIEDRISGALMNPFSALTFVLDKQTSGGTQTQSVKSKVTSE